jgi:hypothetical protein
LYKNQKSVLTRVVVTRVSLIESLIEDCELVERFLIEEKQNKNQSDGSEKGATTASGISSAVCGYYPGFRLTDQSFVKLLCEPLETECGKHESSELRIMFETCQTIDPL